MKICFIGPGLIEIPPTGWGALETVLWNQHQALQKFPEITTCYCNKTDDEETLAYVEQEKPDLIHIHYGSHYELAPELRSRGYRVVLTSHDGSFPQSAPFHDRIVREFLWDCDFFCLTSIERDFLLKMGIMPCRVHIIPNGVEVGRFSCEPISRAEHPDRSICLGKIDARKRQTFLQGMNLGIDFVGQVADPEFNPIHPSYRGSWGRKEVQTKLTNYGNLVLLSRTELQPLVCLEALAAGLGLVLSEAATENLDTSLPFITVVPEEDINAEALPAILAENRAASLTRRDDIRAYAQEFDWARIADKYMAALFKGWTDLQC